MEANKDPLEGLDRVHEDASAERRAEYLAAPWDARIRNLGLSLDDVAEWEAEPDEPRDPIIGTKQEPLFEPGEVVQIVAKSKGFKSWLALDLALHLAAGKDFLGLHVEKPRRVLYVNFELQRRDMKARLATRLRHPVETYQIGPADVAGRLSFIHARAVEELVRTKTETDPISGDVLKPKPDLIDALEGGGVDVVVLDPLYKLLLDGEDESKAPDATRVMRWIKKLATTSGAAVIYVHHEKKGSAGDRDAIDAGSGSGVLARDFDLGVSMVPQRDEPEDASVLRFNARKLCLPDFCIERVRVEVPGIPRPPVFIRRDDLDAAPETTSTKNAREKEEARVAAEKIRPDYTADVVALAKELGLTRKSSFADQLRTRCKLSTRGTETALRSALRSGALFQEAFTKTRDATKVESTGAVVNGLDIPPGRASLVGTWEDFLARGIEPRKPGGLR